MYIQKKYKGLSRENFEVASKVVDYLKEHKVMSGNDFTEIFTETRGLSSQTPKQNWYNIWLFLEDRGLVTRHYLNGFGIYVATPKCSRTLKKNIFKEVQCVYETDIDKAIEWQKVNDGLVPIELEAKIIGEKFLGLEGKTLENFIEITGTLQEYNDEANNQPYFTGTLRFERKMSFLFALRELKIKKI